MERQSQVRFKAQPGGAIKLLAILISIFALASCRVTTPIAYDPDPLNVADPIMAMKKVIEQQPTAYAPAPIGLEIDTDCIKFYREVSRGPLAMPIMGGGGGVIVGPGSTSASFHTVCYKNIGKLALLHDERNSGVIYRVEITDRTGEHMYRVYSFERADCERFIDAITHFLK